MIPPLRAVLIYASLLCAFRGQSAGRLGRRNAARREAADENVDLVCEAAEAPAKSQGALRERDAVYGVRVRGLRSRVAGIVWGRPVLEVPHAGDPRTAGLPSSRTRVHAIRRAKRGDACGA